MNEHWTELVLGVWILVSPWIFGFADISFAKWSNLICGIVLVLVNAWIIFGEKAPEHAVETKTNLK